VYVLRCWQPETEVEERRHGIRLLAVRQRVQREIEALGVTYEHRAVGILLWRSGSETQPGFVERPGAVQIAYGQAEVGEPDRRHSATITTRRIGESSRIYGFR
jgi:hypothetical protein